MALVKFYRGPLSKYDQANMLEGVFFATDTGTIHVNGTTYGGFNKELMDGVITSVDVEGQKLIIKGLKNGAEESTEIPLLKAGDNSIVLGNIQGDAGLDGSTIKVNVQEIGDVDGLKLGDHGLYVDLTKTGAKIDKEISDRTTAINSLNATEQGGAGKFIQSVKEDKGIITAVAADLTATAVNYDKTGDKIIANATDVSAAIKELDVRLANVPGYKVVKLTEEQINTLPDHANVKEAYEVVSVANEDKARLETRTGEVIKIYKDSALESIAYVKDNGKEKGTEGYKEGQFLKYVYTLANGKKETVYVDMSELVDQAEVENGIQAINGKLSVKIDGTGEDFLTVGTDGVKLSGVQTAIDTAKNEVIGGASTGYNTLKGLEDKLKDEAGKIVVLNGDVNTEGSVANAVNKAKDTLQNSINSVQQTANNNATAIQGINTELSKANAIEVKGISDITVTPSTGGSDNHKIFTVSGASLVTKTEYNKLNILAGTGIGVSGDKATGYTISNIASKNDTKVANKYVTSVSQTNGVITVEREQPDAKEIKYTKAKATSSITSTTVQGALEEIDENLQWMDAGNF